MGGPHGRHRRGTPGLVWCRDHASVDAALSVPQVARRGLFERLFARARHLTPARRPATVPATGLTPALG